MGSSASCDDAVSVSIGFKSHLYGFSYKESGVKYGHSLYENMEKNAREIFLEESGSSSASEEEDFDDSAVEGLDISLKDLDISLKDLDISLRETLHIPDPCEPLGAMNLTLNEESIYHQLEANHLSSETDARKGFNKCATVVCSGLVQSYPVNSDAGNILTSTVVYIKNVFDAESPAVLQPLRVTTKPISALKGSRIQHGIYLDAKLSVKWAPDVYDPPITSSSHTVKGHHRSRRHHHHHHHHDHHRAKSKRDYPTSKYSKGRSSKDVVSDRKHAHRRSSGSNPTDPRISRSQAFGCSEPLLESCAVSKPEPLDLAMGSHEAIKYRSSCYVETLAPVQLPVTEAS